MFEVWWQHSCIQSHPHRWHRGFEWQICWLFQWEMQRCIVSAIDLHGLRRKSTENSILQSFHIYNVMSSLTHPHWWNKTTEFSKLVVWDTKIYVSPAYFHSSHKKRIENSVAPNLHIYSFGVFRFSYIYCNIMSRYLKMSAVDLLTS